MPVVNIAGGSVAYLEQGTGKPVLMLHAGGASGKQWLRVATSLEREFRVVAPDLWGFGETDPWRRDEPLSHDHQAELVAEVIHRLSLGPSHVVGHSYGGATAVRLVLNHSAAVKSLILIEPILPTLLKLSGDEELFNEWFDIAQEFLHHVATGDLQRAWERFVDYRNAPGTWAKLAPSTRERLIATTNSTALGFQSNLSNPTSLEDLRRIKVPTLVLCGEKTTAPDRRVTEIVRDHVLQSRYKIVPDADHMSPLSKPSFIAEAIREHARLL